jgi:hypothetical protein
MSSTLFEPEGLSSGRRLYIRLWYSVLLLTAEYFPWKHSPPGDPSGGVVYLRIVSSPVNVS